MRKPVSGGDDTCTHEATQAYPDTAGAPVPRGVAGVGRPMTGRLSWRAAMPDSVFQWVAMMKAGLQPEDRGV